MTAEVHKQEKHEGEEKRKHAFWLKRQWGEGSDAVRYAQRGAKKTKIGFGQGQAKEGLDQLGKKIGKDAWGVAFADRE